MSYDSFLRDDDVCKELNFHDFYKSTGRNPIDIVFDPELRFISRLGDEVCKLIAAYHNGQSDRAWRISYRIDDIRDIVDSNDMLRRLRTDYVAWMAKRAKEKFAIDLHDALGIYGLAGIVEQV